MLELHVKKRRIKQMSAVLLFLVLFLTGCGAGREADPPAGEKSTEKEIQIGLSFDSFVIERWLRDRDVFVSTAEELGAKVNVQNANGSVEEQIEQIEYFIQKKMDVIAIIAIDGDALHEVVRKAKDAGIRIVCYDRLIRNAQTDLYVSFDNRRVGELMGETLREAMPEGGNVFAVYGSKSDNNVTLVNEGFASALEGSGIEIVYSDYCDNWLAELAFDIVNEGLAQNGTVDGVMCGNDDLASQAIRALAEHQLAGRVPVVAQDAELAACQRIMEGTQTMTVYKSVDEEARQAARLSVALGRGEDITDPTREVYVGETINDGEAEIPYYRIEPVAVTKENLDEVIIDSGFHRREDVYLNVADQHSEDKPEEMNDRQSGDDKYDETGGLQGG